MTGDRASDRAVRAALQDVGGADAAWTPSFEAVIARRSTSLVARPRWGAVAVATLLMLAAGFAYRAIRPTPLTVPREVLALSGWTPATNALLQDAQKHVPRYTPRFGTSLLDTLRRDFR